MKRKRGFTLVETIVSMVVLIMLLLFIVSLFSTTRQGLQLSENHVNAAFLGRSLLSDARKAGFDNIIATSGSETFTGKNNGAPFSQSINYNVNVQTLDTDKKLVWAQMSWKESNSDKKVILETIVVNPLESP